MPRRHKLVRVRDGENFRNSIYPCWAIKRGYNDCNKTIVKKYNVGDILWFITSKPYGGKIIGMGEYCGFYDRCDEPLLKINTISNDEQNWKGDEEWDIQIHYCNLYNTERYNFTACIQCAANIMEYHTFKDKTPAPINVNLYDEYKNIIFYAEPRFKLLFK